MRAFFLAFALPAWLLVSSASAQYDQFDLADDDLRVVRIDSSPEESFLAVQADTQGRLFVGGRQSLLVYEPEASGGYRKPRELYRFPNDAWVYDIAISGHDLYVLTVSALYVFPDAVIRREGLAPKRLVWGVPLGHVHQCFHGMAIGPEGDIYFAMGDPLWYYGDFNRPDHWGHWTFFSQPNETPTPYTGVGGVFRCRPDGSQFQVVARGLRNSCGLAFDRHWNLFTNDNDHEQMPAQYVPGRLIHVTPHSYFNWPRGWLLSKSPDRADLLETMFDGMGRAVPVGQAYYGDTLLAKTLDNNLLVARWCIRALTRYPLEPRGASYRVTERHLMDCSDLARPVGVSVGRGGRVFATIAHMAQNEASPIYRSDLVMITTRDDPSTHPFDAYDAVEARPQRLWAELSNPSWSRRYHAQLELLRRGGPLLDEALDRLAPAGDADPAREHLVWLAAAGGRPQARKALSALARRTGDSMLALQTVRALASFPDLKAPQAVFIEALKHSDARVRHAGLLGLFDRGDELPLAEVVAQARSDDTYLRQAACLLLAERATLDQIADLCGSTDGTTRRVGVLAAGFRLTLPPATDPLPDHLPLDPLRNEEAYTIQFADGPPADSLVDLRQHGRVGNFTVADHWKAGSHTDEAEQLFALLTPLLADPEEPVRLQAAHFLSLLSDPRSEPGVAVVAADNVQRRLLATPAKGVLKLWVAGPFPDGPDGFAAVHEPQTGPINLSATYGASGNIAWRTLEPAGSHYNLGQALGRASNASIFAYCRLESGSRQTVQLLVGSDDGVKVWHNGQSVWTNDVVRGALPFQDVITFELEPGSNDILVRVVNRSGDSGLYLHYRSLGDVVAVLPDQFDLGGLAERLAGAQQAGDQAAIAPEFLEVDWAKAAAGGNREQGKKLFEAAGCLKCHAIGGGDGGTVGGPSLAQSGKRFTVPYLVESILLPNRQVSAVFKATAIVTKDGRQFSGLLIGETGDKVELLLSDTKRVSLSKNEIDQRELLELSPMPQGVIKTPEELGDLLAYLLGEMQ